MDTTNRDLDVYNILKDFPKNENDAVIYLRGNYQENGIWVVNVGEVDSIAQTLYNYMNGVENADVIVLGAALAYLNNNKDARKDFKKKLKKW